MALKEKLVAGAARAGSALGRMGLAALQDAGDILAGAAYKQAPKNHPAQPPDSWQPNPNDPLAELWLARGIAARLPGQAPKTPALIKAEVTATGRHIIYTLPAGIAPSETQKAAEAVGVALGGEAELVWTDGRLHVFSYEQPLPDRVDWSPALADQASGSPLAFPVGYSRAGVEIADLARGPHPHMTAGGETNMGKSVFFRQMLVTLHHLHGPAELRIWMVDPKGGVEFRPFASSPLVEALATDAPGADDVLEQVNQVVKDRMHLLARAGVENILGYNARNEPLPYHLVLVDELAELSPDAATGKHEKKLRESCHDSLTRLLRLARFCGVHVITGTQRPDRDTLPGAMKANIGLTLAFHTRNAVNSQILLDHDRAAYLPPRPGRGILQGTVEREVQVPWIGLEEARAVILR